VLSLKTISICLSMICIRRRQEIRFWLISIHSAIALPPFLEDTWPSAKNRMLGFKALDRELLSARKEFKILQDSIRLLFLCRPVSTPKNISLIPRTISHSLVIF